VIVVDTSVILAYMNSADTHHAAVRDWLATEDDDLATTPLIVAEADHLVAARGGRAASSALLGTVEIATLDERHFRAVRPLAAGDAFRLLPRDR